MKQAVPSEFKLGRESFTRGGALSPELLISLLLYMVADGGRRGYTHLLEAFWADARDQGVNLPQETPLSSAAFCNARHKLKPSALRVLLHEAASAFDRQHGAKHRFHGRRILAVDGSKISVQRAPDLWQEFGGPRIGHTPQILVATLFDVLAKVPLDASIAPYASNEREMLLCVFDHLKPRDVLVLDQGFPSYVVTNKLLERKVDVVMRLPITSKYSGLQDFIRSGRYDDDIRLAPSERHNQGHFGPYALRVVRRDGPDGPQVFLTSLSRSSFPRAAILGLYRRRWEVELFFRLEKGEYLGHHQFHARSADGVRQEVFALLLFVTLSRTLMAAAAEIHQVPYERISQKGALLAAATRFIVLLLQSSPERAKKTLHALLTRIARCLDELHRNRSCPRRSFKPASRWGPQGRAFDPELPVQR